MSDTTQTNTPPLPQPTNGDFVPEAAQVSHRKLRQAITEMFDGEELRLLCHDLGIIYDELGGPDTGLSTRVNNLIQYIHRRQRLRVLLIVLREQRPTLSWSQILRDENDPEPIPDTLSATPATPDSQAASDTLIANQTITALIRLMRRPETGEAIVRFQSDFQAASSGIDLMNDLKVAHDLFQELENRYFLIENDRKRLPGDELAWESLALNEPELGTKIDDLLKVGRQSAFAEEAARWLQQAEQVRESMRTAVETNDIELLNNSTRRLFRILNREPSRINAQLIATAKTLRLHTLETAITTLCADVQEPDSGGSALITQIRQGGGALAGIDDRLQKLAAEHDAWQAIDDELRRVETSLDSSLEELDEAWIDLEAMTRDLIVNQNEDWAVALQQAIDALKQAIDTAVLVTARRLFRRYRSQIGRRFRQVDQELLGLCHDLQKVGESLDLLLRTVK